MPNLFPPIRAVSGFGGGRPLKSVGTSLLFKRVNLAPNFNVSTDYDIIPSAGSNKIILPVRWVLNVNTTNAGTGINISMRYAGLGFDIATQLNANNNAIRHTINTGGVVNLTGVVLDTSVVGKAVQAHQTALAGALWAGTAFADIWYLINTVP